MSLIKFNNNENNVKVDLSLDAKNRAKITFINKNDVPDDAEILLGGFKEINEHNFIVQSDFSEMIYIYRIYDDGLTYVFTKDENDIYIEPQSDYDSPEGSTLITLTEEELIEIEKQKQIQNINNQINDLKAQIASTDYQIIKSYEYFLVGIESEYDINILHQTRQELRNEINNLETQLLEYTSSI